MGACTKLGLFAVLVAFALHTISKSTWWLTFDPNNGQDFNPVIDWSQYAHGATAEQASQFQRDGALHLKGFFPEALVHTLQPEVAALMERRTLLSDVFVPNFLPFYKHYSHFIHTLNPVMHDWAVHGPFPRLAQQLIGSDTVRLYNVELIVKNADHPTCDAVWHRDTIASPGDGKTAVFNVYLQDIDDQSDGLIFMNGSQSLSETGPSTYTDKDIIRHRVKVGDVVAHDGDVLHTTSGVGCFGRKSLQFRYIDGSSTYRFDGYRMPSVWHFLHLPGKAGHGLQSGDRLSSPFYPQVYPSTLPAERTAIDPASASVWPLLGAFQQLGALSKKPIEELEGFRAMEGVVRDPTKWEKHPLFLAQFK